jgi:hypothetical protein
VPYVCLVVANAIIVTPCFFLTHSHALDLFLPTIIHPM